MRYEPDKAKGRKDLLRTSGFGQTYGQTDNYKLFAVPGYPNNPLNFERSYSAAILKVGNDRIG